MADEVHEQRRGWLKHGNPPGDWMAAPRCGALTRRKTPCQCPAMRGRRRCRLHGGKSTGPTTATGLARSRRARWKHGAYSREMREMRARVRRSQEEISAPWTPEGKPSGSGRMLSPGCRVLWPARAGTETTM